MRAKTFSGWSLGWLLGALLAAPAAAQEQIPLVTYGPQASPGDGDDDFRQEILLRVPAAVTGELYLRLFDADCGGGLDDSSGPFDTRTRFRLLAPGDGATIASRELGVDAFHDGVWTTLASFYPEAFAADGDERVFKLVVEGLTGDDANVYHLALSRSGKRNLPPPGLRATVAGPTVRLPRAGVRGEIRFFVPAGVGELRVRSYDLAGARIHLETRWRSQLPLASSGQAEWAESTVALAPDESGHVAAVVFAGGGEIPNDATFEVSAGDGRPLPVELPLYLWQRNHRPLPRVGTLALADCRTVVFDGSASSDADGDALEFFWDFGDGARGRGRRTAHAYEAPGRYRARLLLEDASGQVGSSSRLAFDAVLNAPPTAAAGDDLVGAPGAVLRLDAGASADADGEIVRTLWDLGDGTRAESPSVEHAWSEPGTYLVKLRVEDDSASPCNFAIDEAVVWINAPPVVDAGPDRIASPGRTLAFERRRGEDSDGEIVRWEWDFGDGTSLRGRPVEHAWAAPGTYEVTLTVTDDAAAANSTASDRLRVRVNDPPAAAAGPDRRVAVGEPIRFDAGGSLDRDGEIIARRWQFGDGAEAAGVEVSHAFAEPGRYRVTLTVRDDSASTSDTAADVAEVIVNHPPAARAGDDQHLTASAVTFDGRASGDADGEIIAWRWDFGDGATSSEAAPVHVYRSPGTYRVRLVVTDDSGTSSRQSSDELAVVVNAAPIADAGGDRVTAPGRTLRFAADASVDPDGTVVAWAWDFGDGTDATGAAVEHAWERPGTYTVRLRVSDDSGHPLAVGYDQATVVVNRAPVARAGPDRRVAPGDEVTFDGRGSYDLDGG
ncbi:MAG: PKD domain-containing protein, partial [bacterium]|nr:PKD domain-containing protein [bacterium]